MFFTTLQVTEEVKGYFFLMILIVGFLNHIQEKNVGRQRNAGDGGT
jgi:hypothetical protein